MQKDEGTISIMGQAVGHLMNSKLRPKENAPRSTWILVISGILQCKNGLLENIFLFHLAMTNDESKRICLKS